MNTQQALTGSSQVTTVSHEESEIRNELIADFQETAQWRRSLIARFPSDDRNASAAELLDRLIASVQDVASVQLLEYAQTLDRLETDAELDEALRWIGYRTFPASCAAYVCWFIARHKISGQ